MTIGAESPRRTYFHNLDGLRLIASVIIIVLHIEDVKSRQGIQAISFIRNYSIEGNFDVSLFFVLSGFLISYLLLKEKKNNGSINLKAFYIRRALRIWPLYYFVLILGFFVLPYFDKSFNHLYSYNIYNHFWLYFTGCFFMLSPLVRSVSGLPLTIGPIWSVGVEELFYYSWPLFLRNTKKYLLFFLIVIMLTLVLRNGFFLADDFIGLSNSFTKLFIVLRAMIMEYRISCMAIGGIAAYLVVFEKNKILSLLFRKDVQWLVYMLTISMLLLKVGGRPINKEEFPSIYHELFSVLFAIIIVNLAVNTNSILRLDYRWMTYLGKISYGLYLYHPIMRIFSLEFTEHIFNREISGWQMNACLYSMTFLSTILISILSYEYFEKYFMKLKSY